MPTRRETLAGGVALAAVGHGTVRRRRQRECPLEVSSDADARIGFVGDVMLGRNVDDRWSDGPPAGVWGGTFDRLNALDGLVLNLECCLSDRGERTPDRGYYFRADPDWAVPALTAAGTSFASLANNHLLDFGPVALSDTRNRLTAADVAYAGAGPDRESAFDPAVAAIGDVDVGFVSLTDQARSYAAGPDSAGTAYLPLDYWNSETRRTVDDALATLAESDPEVVVASLHWGPNWVIRPADHHRRFAHWLVDRGVDVVHGHSAHVLQGVEVYRGRPIIYDAGDFVDDYVVKPDLHNDRSALFELVVRESRATGVRVVPVEIVDEAVQPAGTDAATWIRERLRTLSDPFDTTVERNGDGLWIPLAC